MRYLNSFVTQAKNIKQQPRTHVQCVGEYRTKEIMYKMLLQLMFHIFLWV